MMTGKHAAHIRQPNQSNSQSKGDVYLQRMRMGAFGRFVDKTVGPFDPGLNVVYGANEAGKTTTRAFIGGVLFGWPEARGGRNAYKPKAADREGTLVFCDQAKGEIGSISRARNADGVSGDDAWVARVCSDIDKETFQTLFSLDGDELRSLEGASDISAKLLTAGSATKVSPAQVASSLDGRISAYSSRAAAETESFPNLARELDSVKRRIADARARADEFKSEDVELRQLISKRDGLAGDLASVNSRIERLAACKGGLARAESKENRLEEELFQARLALRECEAQLNSAMASRLGVSDVSLEDEQAFRAKLEPLLQRELDTRRRSEAARDAYEQARGLWEAQSESSPTSSDSENASGSRRIALAAFVVGVVLCAAAIVFALRDSSLSLVCAASFLAAAAAIAFGCFSLRREPAARTSAPADSVRSTMAACKSIYDAREGEVMVVADEVSRALAEMGFFTHAQTAQRALADLDAAAASRAAVDKVRESLEIARIRYDEASRELSAATARRIEMLAAAGLSEESTLEDMEAAAESLSARRVEIDSDLAEANLRIGQLKQLLSDGLRETEFDLLKTNRAQIATRQRESAEDLARLLLARRLVIKATDSWGAESQPEVYTRASRLMDLMTSGAWVGVKVEGPCVYAVDLFGRVVESRMLSLGTCQQLYLALRIALLECAPEVGSCVPVLCDDILANFDDERRAGAISALEQLSRTRQVIVFTCHKEVVSAFTEQTERVHVLRL